MFEKQRAPVNASKDSSESQANVRIELYKRNWMDAFKRWKKRLTEAKDEQGVSRAPYKEHWELMHAIHERCVQEAKEEQQGKVNRDGREPARLFCHGLPGSGKTQVMKWMAEYFEEVWGWVAGSHYVRWFISNPFLTY